MPEELSQIKRQNAERVRHEIRNNIGRVRSYPVTIGIAANKTCNVHCIFCLAKERTKESIDWHHFKRMEPVFPYVSEIIFSGEEVVLHPNIWDMFDMLTRNQILVNFFSNGKALKPETMEWLVDHGIAHISCSFHGATPDTYNGIVRGADFDTVVRQFRHLKEYRVRKQKELGRFPGPGITFHYVMMRRNAEELPKFLELAAELGADRVIAKYMMIYNHLKHLTGESLYFYPGLTNRIIEHCTDKAGNQLSHFVPPLKFSLDRTAGRQTFSPKKAQAPENRTPPLCTWPWRQCNISVNGDVEPCCSGLPPMGNIYEKSFEEIWNCDRYVELRETVNTPNRWPECSRCTYLTHAADIDDIRTHLVYLKDQEDYSTAPDLIHSEGLFTEDELLLDQTWKTFVSLESGMSGLSDLVNGLSQRLSRAETDYLLEKINRFDELDEHVFLALMLRMLNRFGRGYVAYRLTRLWRDNRKQENMEGVSNQAYRQIQVEDFYSEISVGYYKDAMKSFASLMDAYGPDKCRPLAHLFNDQAWGTIRDRLDNELEAGLITLIDLMAPAKNSVTGRT